jgi:hypothetical protein
MIDFLPSAVSLVIAIFTVFPWLMILVLILIVAAIVRSLVIDIIKASKDDK